MHEPLLVYLGVVKTRVSQSSCYFLTSCTLLDIARQDATMHLTIVGFLVCSCVLVPNSAQDTESRYNDVFSSVAKMEALVHQENAIVDMLDAFLIEAKQRLNIIQE